MTPMRTRCCGVLSLIKVRDLTLPLLAVNRVAGDAAVPVTSAKESRHATGGVDGPPADEGPSRECNP
jgi:hypothetical protein